MNISFRIILSGCIICLFQACSTKGPPWIFGKKSPHERYGDRLESAGLHTTDMGMLWFAHAEKSLQNASRISIPYKETGYFAAELIRAEAWKFEAKRGEQLKVSIDKRPKNFNIYLDLFQDQEDNTAKYKAVAFADTSQNLISYEIKKAGTYRLRIQPELLGSGEYTLTITSGPSLAYPIRAPGKNHIKSFWGADRDDGSRRHEGIDLFGPKRAPAVAAADGIINRVTENRLGGKVIFMRPNGKDYNLYYAHLDEQLAKDGQSVKAGDTIGLIGNTGNARNTPPHLHFGIYTSGGAIDPLPFVNPEIKEPPKITASLSNLNTIMRTRSGSTHVLKSPVNNAPVITTVASQSIVRVESAHSSWYKVSLPEGNPGYLKANQVVSAETTLRKLSVPANQPVYDKPDTTAARKAVLSNTTVNVVGEFGEFYFIKDADLSGWINKK